MDVKFAGFQKRFIFVTMPAAKFLKPERPIKFDDAMRRLVKLPPPPSGKKSKRKAKASTAKRGKK